MDFDIECLVIGAGVIGLACARRLSQAGLSTIVVDKASGVGQGISSRSSEVVHSGIYYPRDSLKSQLCLQGRGQLLNYLENYSIKFRKHGKIIVATCDTELAILEGLMANARAICLDDARFLDGSTCQKFEPNLAPTIPGGILIENVGVFDSHGYMLALQADIENTGGLIIPHTSVLRGTVTPNFIEIEIDDKECTRIHCQFVINATGLMAVNVAKAIKGKHEQNIPRSRPTLGRYAKLSGASPFSRLIYPVAPHGQGLGIHSTIDVAGMTRFGPDFTLLSPHETPESVLNLGNEFLPSFYDFIRRYWPGLPDNSLHTDYAGIRPKIERDGEIRNDFEFDITTDGMTALVNLYGIESPGLTASLAIADEMMSRLNLDNVGYFSQIEI